MTLTLTSRTSAGAPPPPSRSLDPTQISNNGPTSWHKFEVQFQRGAEKIGLVARNQARSRAELTPTVSDVGIGYVVVWVYGLIVIQFLHPLHR